MPSFTEHVRRSVERTGEGYQELNEWLDGDQVSLLPRLQRHFRFRRYSKYVQCKWGEDALKEYRNHLNDDFRMPFITLGLIFWKKLLKLTTRTAQGGETKR